MPIPLPASQPVISAVGALSPLRGAPDRFAVSGASVLRTFHAAGAQIYQCRPSPGAGLAWTFLEPTAVLFEDAKAVGRHYAGPRWELASGEVIRAKPVASAPGATPADADLLKLEVVQHAGGSSLEAARVVLRLRTRGGALKGPCARENDVRAAAYSADYIFLR